MAFKEYRSESKKNWGTDRQGELDAEQISLGCVLRIADSLERMEQPYLELINQVKLNSLWYKQEQEKRKKLERKNAALKAWVTRLKNQLKELQ